MTTQKGKIAITTENIFPIIKKFLYSEHEIFLRELISNAIEKAQSRIEGVNFDIRKHFNTNFRSFRFYVAVISREIGRFIYSS